MNNETNLEQIENNIKAILREMREEGQTGPVGETEWVAAKMRRYADRIEAALDDPGTVFAILRGFHDAHYSVFPGRRCGMTNDEKADYIAKRLVEVKKILDEIAENTGEVMVVFGESVAMLFAALGQNFTNFILKTQDLLADRLVLANKFRAKEMDKQENETPDDVVREMKNFCAPNMEAAKSAWAEFDRRYQAAMERSQNRKETK